MVQVDFLLAAGGVELVGLEGTEEVALGAAHARKERREDSGRLRTKKGSRWWMGVGVHIIGVVKVLLKGSEVDNAKTFKVPNALAICPGSQGLSYIGVKM